LKGFWPTFRHRNSPEARTLFQSSWPIPADNHDLAAVFVSLRDVCLCMSRPKVLQRLRTLCRPQLRDAEAPEDVKSICGAAHVFYEHGSPIDKSNLRSRTEEFRPNRKEILFIPGTMIWRTTSIVQIPAPAPSSFGSPHHDKINRTVNRPIVGRFRDREKYHPELFPEELDYCECRGCQEFVRSLTRKFNAGDTLCGLPWRA